MADIVPADVRSRMMAGIRSRDTKPEILLRKGLHATGFRFRLHVRGLPGKPDMVFPRYRAVIFANGCFWHGHDCHLFKQPATRREFWRKKVARNRAADARAKDALENSGWREATVWECALKGRTRLLLADVIAACAEWLRSDRPRMDIRGT